MAIAATAHTVSATATYSIPNFFCLLICTQIRSISRAILRRRMTRLVDTELTSMLNFATFGRANFQCKLCFSTKRIYAVPIRTAPMQDSPTQTRTITKNEPSELLRTYLLASHMPKMQLRMNAACPAKTNVDAVFGSSFFTLGKPLCGIPTRLQPVTRGLY